MRFIVDACTGPTVAAWLEEQGHNVVSVHEIGPSWSDSQVLQQARKGNYILITNDKDFGELVFRTRRRHRGVILLHRSSVKPIAPL
jgi:predicted nuclease of predicted toxin-antitoxin system